MSVNDFNARARLQIQISVSGFGQFDPFGDGPLNWTLNGTVNAQSITDDRTTKEKTCGVGNETTKTFQTFDMSGSTGGTSGTINTGQLAQPIIAEAGLGGRGPYRGDWIVNTDPVLSSGGFLDGNPAPKGYYVVAQPEDAGVDDPIELSPPIDGIVRVYPGDRIYLAQLSEDTFWQYDPQERFPKPDRTFFWTPNTEPVIASGGLLDGDLALPGTIVIPTAEYYIEPPADAIDGMRYFYNGIGMMFDGAAWRQQLLQPSVYQPPTGPREFRNTEVRYVSPQRYERRLEQDEFYKPFVYTVQPIDDSVPLVYTLGDPPTTEDFYFRWLVPAFFSPTNIQPNAPYIYDFGNAYSAFHEASRQWLLDRNLSAGLAAVITDLGFPPREKMLAIPAFKTGTTEIVETANFGAENLVNTFTIAINIVPSLA